MARAAKVGRPSAYDPKKHPDLVLEEGAKGHSESQMAKACGVARSTMREWAEKHDEFRSAFTRAKTLAQSWWEEQAQLNVDNKNFNSNLFRISTQARFKEDYTQTTKQEVTTKTQDAPTDARSVARALLTVLGKEGLETLDLAGVTSDDERDTKDGEKPVTH